MSPPEVAMESEGASFPYPLSHIDPKNPRYSYELHRFLRRHRKSGLWRAYRVTGHKSDNGIWIGWKYPSGLLAGLKLSRIVIGTRPLRHLQGRLEGGDIVELPKFWERYKALGICVVDPKHKDYGYRWSVNRKTGIRTCRYCKLQQEPIRTYERVMRVEWVKVENDE